MLKNTKLKTQILLVCSFPIICLLILSSLIYKNAVDSFQMQMEAQEAETTILEASYMAWGIGRVVRNVRGYLLFPDDQTYKESYDEGLEMFRQAYADLNQHVKSPQRRQQIDLLLSEGEQNVAISEEVFRLVDAGQLEAAKSQIQALRMKAVDDTRDEIIKSETAVLSRTRQALAQAQYRLMASVVLGTLVAVAGSAMLSLWLVRWITRQIAEVVKTAEQISVGNLTAEVTVDAASQNELDQLLNTFQVMIDNLNLLVCQVQRSGLQATTSVTQIAASGRQLEATVTEQVASTHEVVATAKQIAITANELAYTLDNIAEVAQTTAIAANDSQTNLGHMGSTIQTLVNATQAIATKLQLINTKANTINSVVLTITKVADQTNLLSLNAAIEAEKAGESGRGFSVVAREIRRLADQTAVATLDIEQMVKEMQSAVSSGVMEMDKFTQEVGRSVTDVGNVSDQLGQIIHRVQTLTPQFDAVSQGMNTQAQGAQQISEAMEQLSETSSQTVLSLQDINNAIAQLTDVTQNLHNAIARFQIKTKTAAKMTGIQKDGYYN